MVALNNAFLADASGLAAAMGDVTSVQTTTATTAVPGLAAGFAAAVAFAQDAFPGVPQTLATTSALAVGGHITSGSTAHLSIDFPYGSAPVSLDVSIAVMSTYGGGDVLSGYALSGVAPPSVHGLL